MTNPQETETIEVPLLAVEKIEKIVDFVQNIDPELERIEALLLAAEILDRLPELLQANPNIITSIQQASIVVKQNRVQ